MPRLALNRKDMGWRFRWQNRPFVTPTPPDNAGSVA
jgi:hypothetical protein